MLQQKVQLYVAAPHAALFEIDLSIYKFEKTQVLNTLMNTIGFTTVEKELICSFVNLASMHSLYRKVNEGYLDHIPLIVSKSIPVNSRI
jgi:hypothetical protein